MTLDISDKDFHLVNEFDNFFNFEYMQYKDMPELYSPQLAKICKEIKANLLERGATIYIDPNIKLYRARKIAAVNMLFNEENIDDELPFWEDYLKSYFSCFNCEELQNKFIARQAHFGACINEDIGKSLKGGYRGYNKEQSGAPPIKNCINDRCSIAGERVLYLGESIETCLLECNANREEIVSIGEFVPIEKLKIYGFAESETDYCRLWLSNIFSEVSQKNKYLKSQVLTRMIKEMGYDGVEYRSAKTENGICFAIFDPKNFNCECSYLVKPTAISISFIK